MRNGTIEVELPFMFKLGIMQFPIRRKIGFSFDQRSMFILLKNNNIDMPGYSKWRKKVNTNTIVSETMFAAAQSYCEERRIKDNFTKKKLLRSFSDCDDKIKELIVKCWKESEELGYKKLPGKKKVRRR